jgi:hypothetical protein
VLVEGVDVSGGGHGQLLDLPFGGHFAAALGQRLPGGLEGAARRLGRRPLGQGVGVQPVGQVQGRVSGIKVASSLGPPGAAGHPHPAQHRGQVTGVARLDPAMTDPVGVDDRGDARLGEGVLLACRAQVQVVLEQQPQHLPALRGQVLLELATRSREGQRDDQR